MMKDLFLCLFMNICKFGNIESANLYSADFSTLYIDTEDGKYCISIRKEENQEDK